MSREILEEINSLCRSAAINACWHQWSALGALVSSISRRQPAAIIDPEALLVLSAAFRKQERRLEDVIIWWASVGSTLVSVQRLRSILSQFPGDVHHGIAIFAHTAHKSGDRRWRSFAPLPTVRPHRQLKGTKQPVLTEPATLLFRLRAGFGVGVKSDLLAFLLGMQGSIATVKRIVEALSYSRMAISTAAQQMAQARLIEETSERPVGYFVHARPWAEVLKLASISESGSRIGEDSGVPAWRFWPLLFSFLSHVSDWVQPQVSGRMSPYVLSSQARDLYYTHKHAFALNGIPVPEAERYKGEGYLEAFRLTLMAVLKWLHDNL